MIIKKECAFCFRNEKEELWVEPFGKNGLHVFSGGKRFSTYPNGTLQNPDYDPVAVAMEQSDEGVRIINGKITCQISKDGHLSFYDQKGVLLTEEYVQSPVLHVPAREMRYGRGGDFKLVLRMSSDPDEKFYGMGQYQHGFLNLKGLELELAQKNTQASVPFAVSSKGYGFLWNNPAVGMVFFGKDHVTWRAESTEALDYWITSGETPAEIVENYASVTGTVPMMPDYAMGFWQSKLRYHTQEELLNIAREYKKRDLPLSVIVVDYFHWPVYGDWKFDEKNWPDVPGMVRELKEMGIELAVSIWPTVSQKSGNYAEMSEKGFLLSVLHGLPYSMDFEGNTRFYDATNPDARLFVWNRVKENYYKQGIHTFWLDAIEPEYSTYDYENYRFQEGSALKVGNSYPLFCAKAFFDGQLGEGKENIISLCRCAWAGSQRYGALVWSGDIPSTFESFRRQLAAGLNMGLAGIPWWTTDIGGFTGGNILSEEFRELLIRWFQFGAYSPVMRLHGARIKEEKGIVEYEADNEVWSFGDTVYEICRHYLEIREELRPYIKELMRQAHQTGTPVMRTLFYEFPEDEKSWEVEDEYLFGPEYLVAPVFAFGQRTRKVYLPKGADWEELETGRTYQGGQEVCVEAPLERMPVFVRKVNHL